MNVIYYYNLEQKVLVFLHVLINSKYHNDPSPTPPCSMLFSHGYCFILQSGGGGGGGELFIIS